MKANYCRCLLFLAFIFTSISMNAQGRTIIGKVTDDTGGPLPGVNVIVKSTEKGTQTDFDGNYSINATSTDVLVFSYVGFKTQEISVGSKNSINVRLETDAAELEEVVVEAYRTTKKATSNISSITIGAQNIEARPNASFVQTLQGQVAGLNITTSSGQPGANSVINLRGVSSLNGNTEPLFIIDGIPVDEDNFRSLNPNEIESVTTLKDIGATAIYGNRGANGVIVIKTKKGGYDSKLKINYTGLTSFAKLQSASYDLLNSQEALTLERSFGQGRGFSGGIDGNGNARPLTDAEIAAAANTDWLNFFFRTAITQNHTLTLSSGSKNLSSFTSLGYFDQEGILNQSSLKRFNVRNNLNGQSDNEKFKYSSNISINYSRSDEPNNIGTGAVNRNLVFGAYQSLPYVTPEDYTSGRELAQDFNFPNTPLYLIDRLATFTRVDEEVKILASLNTSYKLTDDLTISSVIGADYTDEEFLSAEGPESRNAIRFGDDEDPDTPGRQVTTPGFQSQQSTRVLSFNSLTTLNYRKTFGDAHTIDASAFLEYFKAHYRTYGFNQQGLNPVTFVPGDGDGFVGDNGNNDFFVDVANANILNAGLFSYFGQLDYDYSEKYGLSGTLRRDASYRFASSNRWGTFYSVAARWNIYKESFMEDSVFDVLKLRMSYGTAGNQRITDAGNLFQYFAASDLTLNLYSFGSGYGRRNSIFLSQIANPDLKWETVTSFNVGTDFEVFNRRLRGTLEYYIRDTSDLFQSVGQSAITGTTAINSNFGELRNSGFDLNLAYDLIKGNGEDLNVTLNFVGNYNKQEVIDIPAPNGEDRGNNLREGGIIGEYLTVRYAGVNPANGNLLFYDIDGNLTENPDPDTDAVWLDKNIFPDFQGSFGFNIDYKNFFLQANFNYTLGVYRFDNQAAGFLDPDSIGNFRTSSDLLRAWTPDNRNTDVPSLRATNKDIFSDRFLRDSDYLRLRFASFGYNVPKRYLQNTGFSSIRAFVNGENLFTLSEWEGFDAERLINDANGYPTPRTFSVGFEFSF